MQGRSRAQRGTHDRDENTAINIEREAFGSSEPIHPEELGMCAPLPTKERTHQGPDRVVTARIHRTHESCLEHGKMRPRRNSDLTESGYEDQGAHECLGRAMR